MKSNFMAWWLALKLYLGIESFKLELEKLNIEMTWSAVVMAKSG